MLFSNLHVGTNMTSFDSRLKGILLGVRKKTTILNLKISILQLQIVSHLVINLISKRQPILLIKEWTYLDFNDYINNELQGSLENLIMYQQKWLGGLLTNHKSVFFSSKLNNTDLLTLRSKKKFPSLVCFFNTNLAKWALWESYNLKVPLSALIDSDSQFFGLIHYPVISNNKSINSSLLYLSTICNSIKYGRKKEVFRVLSISIYKSRFGFKQKGKKKNLRQMCNNTLKGYVADFKKYKKVRENIYKKFRLFKEWKRKRWIKIRGKWKEITLTKIQGRWKLPKIWEKRKITKSRKVY